MKEFKDFQSCRLSGISTLTPIEKAPPKSFRMVIGQGSLEWSAVDCDIMIICYVKMDDLLVIKGFGSHEAEKKSTINRVTRSL